jgi:hypothetical protein
MVLNLLPLVVLAASLVAGGVLLRRHLPRRAGGAAGVTGMACVRCGAPAVSMAPDSFNCPGCGHDVRETGLADPAAHLSLRPLWEAMLYTIAVLILALLTTGLAASAVPASTRIFSSSSLGTPRSRTYVGVEVARLDAGPFESPDGWRWEATADLSLLDGRAAFFDASGPPTRWAATGPDGNEVASGKVLDEQAVLQWFGAACLDGEDELLRSEARDVLRALRPARDEDPALHAGSAMDSMAFASRGTRSNTEVVRNEWAAPAVSAAWSLIWVAGLWVVLRVSARRHRKPAEAVATVAAPAAGAAS